MLSKIARSSRSVAPLHLRTIAQRGFHPAGRPSIELEARKDTRRKTAGQNSNLADAETMSAVEDPTKIPKRMASSLPSRQTSRSSVRDGIDSPTVIRSGSIIEEGQRGVLEDLLFGSETKQVQNPRGLADQNATKAKMPSQPSPSSETGYVIDPITNRKVYKVETPTSLGDALTAPAIKSQFSGVESAPKSDPAPLVYSKPGPVFDPEFPMTQEELQGYSQLNMDSNSTGIDGGPSGNVFWHHVNGVTTKGYFNQSRPEKYHDLARYKPVMEKSPATPEDPAKEYQDLKEYQPVMTERTLVSENPSTEYEDLNDYEPVFVEKLPVDEDPSKKYTDLDQYKPAPNVKKIPNPHEKEVYKDLPGYSAAHDVEAFFNPYEKEVYQDLHLYASPYPDVEVIPNQFENEAYTDLHLYQAGFAYCEPDGKPLARNSHEKEAYSDLDTYHAFRYNEPDGKPDEAARFEKETYTDLPDYSQGYRACEPNGRYAFQEADANMSEPEINREMKAMNLSYIEPGSRGTISKVAHAVSNIFNMDSTPHVYERSWGLTSHGKLTNCKDSKIISFPPSKRGPPLTGSKEEADSYGYSLKPMGLETSYANERHGRSTWPTFTRMYGTLESVSPPFSTAAKSKGSNDTTSPKSSSQPPSTTSSSPSSLQSNFISPVYTSYKILAYDPATQTVEMAQTTSTVPDGTTGLPPAEALVRLAHPTKFFPYFATLQSQGFEIISGSEDVLIFRKNRQAPIVEEPVLSQVRAINPIDMTGAPNCPSSATAFLSPTGFSRYEPDPDPVNDQRPPPPRRFRSETRRDTFGARAGGQSSTSWSEPKRSSKASPRVAKKIFIGAASALGIAYAVAVMAEFLKGY